MIIRCSGNDQKGKKKVREYVKELILVANKKNTFKAAKIKTKLLKALLVFCV